MTEIERILHRELRRDRRVLPHVRRRHARRLAAAIEAEGCRVAAPPVPQPLPTSSAGLAGLRFGTELAAAVRQVERFTEGLVRGLGWRRP
ncbi:hypothetical protein OKC48_07435 [Methylorubrum extorquens]|uniref:hypothetical protein n=1 Tax=Methylorubrum extorquens TaxID=408 RepID=UPI0022371616|nr:hypothetical protein [Methylorubrum extorquens]UYW28338.1 hypothetical protein OKC48_07435 [Methylorubrum extorquens]